MDLAARTEISRLKRPEHGGQRSTARSALATVFPGRLGKGRSVVDRLRRAAVAFVAFAGVVLAVVQLGDGQMQVAQAINCLSRRVAAVVIGDWNTTDYGAMGRVNWRDIVRRED